MCVCVCVCVCECIYVYMCVCVCMYVHTCMYMCMYVWIFVCVCMYVHMHACMYVCICVYVYVYVHVWMYVCMQCMYVRMYVCDQGKNALWSTVISRALKAPYETVNYMYYDFLYTLHLNISPWQVTHLQKTAFELSMPVPLHEMMNKISDTHSYCIMCEKFSYLHSELHTSFSFLTIIIADRLARIISCICNSWRGGLSALLSASVNVCEYQWCFLTAFFGAA